MSESSATVKLTLTFTRTLKKEIVKEAHEMFGKRKGAISTYVEMILRKRGNLMIINPGERK